MKRVYPHLVQHHEKYKEIHGEDKIVLLTQSEHRLLHLRLRKEGKCNISIDEMKKLTQIARRRTKQFKDKQKECGILYRKKNKYMFQDWETVGNNIELRTAMVYNKATGHITVYSYFMATNKTKLRIIDEKISKVQV